MLRCLFLVLTLLTGNEVYSRAQYNLSLVEHTLNRVKVPLLHAVAGIEKTWHTNQKPAFTCLNSAGNITGDDRYFLHDNLISCFSNAPIPEFRKYQNSHIAPTRMIVGGGAIATGGAMMIAGYRQDTKYPWSGPSISASPLNVFGALIIIVGLGLMTSGYIFYRKYKKHMVLPYNKSY